MFKSILIEISNHLSSLSNGSNLNKLIQMLLHLFETETTPSNDQNDSMNENMGKREFK